MGDSQYANYAASQPTSYGSYGTYNTDSSYSNTNYSSAGWSNTSNTGSAASGTTYSGYGQDQYSQQTAQQYGYGQQPPTASSTYGQGGPGGGYGDRGRGNFGNQGPGRGGFNKGGRGGFSPMGNGGGYGKQQYGEEIQDTIFIQGLPPDVNEQQLSEFFGAIGVIKVDKKTGKPKIWIYKDKNTGRGKGEATVTYDDPPTATSAINWFHGRDFEGGQLTVQLAQRKVQSFGGDRGGGRDGGRDGGRGGMMRGGRGRGGGGGRDGPGGGGGSGRDGDWKCPNPDCGNNNFSWRQSCNRCQAPRPDNVGDGNSDGPMPMRGGPRGGMRGGRGGDRGGGRGGMGGRGGGGMGGRGGGGGFGRGGPGRGGGGPMRGPGGGDRGDRRSRPY